MSQPHPALVLAEQNEGLRLIELQHVIGLVWNERLAQRRQMARFFKPPADRVAIDAEGAGEAMHRHSLVIGGKDQCLALRIGLA